MSYTRVKICGITQLDDALHACRMGADAIGFVFCEKSPRSIDIEKAAEICSKLPAFVTAVALFMDAEESQVQSVLNEMSIDCLQFHGQEGAQFCRQFNRPYIKAIAMDGESQLNNKVKIYHDARGILLDSHAPGQVGGTGQTFDWNDIPNDLAKPIILAGGLNAENVAEAVKTVRPYAVDVSSGVEREKGLKDAQQVAAFIHEVKHVG